MKMLMILLLLYIICLPVHAEALGALMARADWGCVRLEPAGQTCTRVSPPYAGVRMRYWQPMLLVETVKSPGETAIDELRSLTGEPLRQMARAAMQQGDVNSMDSGSGYSSDTTSLQMNDVHVLGFPASDTFSSIVEPVCEGAPDISGPVSYLSETDAAEWRTLRNESRLPPSVMSNAMAPMCDRSNETLTGMCMGTWGPLYPRGGFIAANSPAVGSAAAAYRGVDIASMNILSNIHRRVLPLMFVPDMLWDRMQMVYPRPTRCLRIGEDPRSWDQGRGSQDGKYVWIYWRKKECCAL